jgi:hypothetical protein
MHIVNMAGQTIGRWEILNRDPLKKGRAYWICKCVDCGTTQSVSGTHLREEIKGGCRKCRGAGHKKKYPLEYSVWQNIKVRVLNKNRAAYAKYSSLGMCAEWEHDFLAFYNHIGPRPSLEHSVDRIDNSKGYFPGNVRWATTKEQARNTGRNLVVGDKILIDVAKELNVKYNTARDRFHKNQPLK